MFTHVLRFYYFILLLLKFTSLLSIVQFSASDSLFLLTFCALDKLIDLLTMKCYWLWLLIITITESWNWVVEAFSIIRSGSFHIKPMERQYLRLFVSSSFDFIDWFTMLESFDCFQCYWCHVSVVHVSYITVLTVSSSRRWHKLTYLVLTCR